MSLAALHWVNEPKSQHQFSVKAIMWYSSSIIVLSILHVTSTLVNWHSYKYLGAPGLHESANMHLSRRCGVDMHLRPPDGNTRYLPRGWSSSSISEDRQKTTPSFSLIPQSQQSNPRCIKCCTIKLQRESANWIMHSSITAWVSSTFSYLWAIRLIAWMWDRT
jgi:hypothetical protein